MQQTKTAFNTWSLGSAYHHCSRRSGFANQDTTNRNSLQMVHKPSKKDSTADSISHVTMYIVFQGTKYFEIGYFEMWKITLQRSHLVVQIQYLYKYYPGIFNQSINQYILLVQKNMVTRIFDRTCNYPMFYWEQKGNPEGTEVPLVRATYVHECYWLTVCSSSLHVTQYPYLLNKNKLL